MTNSIVLSVDLELFTHTPAYRGAEGIIGDKTIGLEGVEFLLNLFDKYNVTSTFFVVSEVAESNPEVIKRIAANGHEIASHTHTHRLLSEIESSDVYDELVRSKEVLESVVDLDISGFRAPAFDRPDDLFELLHEIGYRYDSSIAPARSIPGWYGGEYSINKPVTLSTLDKQFPKQLVELPVSVMPGVRLPISAAWIRLLGSRYFSTGIKWLHKKEMTPVIYVHPWEFVELPVINGVPKRVYWHTGSWFRQKIEALVSQEYDFCTAGELAETVTT